MRVNGEGQGNAVALSEFVSELAEGVGGNDRDLIDKDLVAVLITEVLALGIEPAGVDGSLEAPGMHGQREVMAHERNLVLGGSLAEQGVGTAAVRTLHIFKFDNGYTGAGWRLESAGVVDLGSGGLRRKLRVGWD